MKIISKIFGDPVLKEMKQLDLIVEQVNALEAGMEKLSDKELKAQTNKLKQELKGGKALDDILPEAFATVREAAKRVIGQRHYDVQILAGIVMHQGTIVEMKTGEGKTLAATCPVYLNSLSGKGVHVVTVNDYLAMHHANWMGQIYDFLGLTIGYIGQQGTSSLFNGDKKTEEGEDAQYLEECNRKDSYQCDVLYGTNNEFGFDYLRDNMVQSIDDMVQRELNFGIVDEVDSILVDEARTPLIISAPDTESTDKYRQFAKIVTGLSENEDYNIDEKMKAATLTEEGIEKVEKSLGVENIYAEGGISDVHHIEQALKAQVLFKREKDYVIKDGEVVIVDEFTGRLMFGRRYSEGLHQAIEAKENVTIQRESKTLATISFQNYFRLYEKLSGMTGTAVTEAEEFSKIYNLDVLAIPTNKPLIRKDLNDKIYKNESGKFQALVKEVKERSKTGQPILIGTVSIEKNELVADLLAQEGVECQVLNAKAHEKEANIIAQAGKFGSVTVATNMAGRGVDINLGGHPYDEKEYQKVLDIGGLFVLGTERHESRRIDNQLRGRAGRQGDPGGSQFYLSLDDDVMRIFGSERMKSVMNTLKVPDDMPIENGLISKSIEQAQKKVEGHNFDIRKHLVDYDDVMNKQRMTVYRKRQEILAGKNIKQNALDTIFEEIGSIVKFHTQAEEESRWNMEEIYEAVGTIYPLEQKDRIALDKIDDTAGDEQEDNMARRRILGYLKKGAVEAYNELEEKINMMPIVEGSDLKPMDYVAKGMILRAIDTLWVEHLESVQYMRTGIGLRGYGQRDPLVEYKREGMKMFKDLLESINKQFSYSIYKIGMIDPAQVQGQQVNPANINLSAPSKESSQGSPFEADSGIEERKSDKIIKDASHYDGEKVGRNDPCPCGSGEKYKKCHGK